MTQSIKISSNLKNIKVISIFSKIFSGLLGQKANLIKILQSYHVHHNLKRNGHQFFKKDVSKKMYTAWCDICDLFTIRLL